MRSPFPLFLDATRTLLRNHSSISILPQSAHSCKGSSDTQSCCCGVPSNTSVILGHVGSPVTSGGWSLSPGCSSQARAQVPTWTPLFGMNMSSRSLGQRKTICVLDSFSPDVFQLAFTLKQNGICLCAAQVSCSRGPWHCSPAMSALPPALGQQV